MAAAVRQGMDPSAGHCYPPRAADAGSGDVIVNGAGLVRVGDHYPTHQCGNSSHDGTASSGSATVIVNGKAAHRIGDDISCGDVAAGGSADVFIGDGSFPVAAVKEPGVMLIGNTPIYDNTPPGQAAARRDEDAFDPGLSKSESVTAPPPVPAEQPGLYAGCDKFPDVITLNEMYTKVSKYFSLSHSAKSGMIVAQRGLSGKQIACNWAALCTNVLDKVYEQFKFNFNSGFRTVASGMGNTDHGIGCAADISMGNDADTIAMFKWIVSNQLPFSQVIYEKHNSSWVHVSYNGAGPKGDARTMWTFTGGPPYGHGGQTGQNLIASLKPDVINPTTVA
jgi:uncharacterized Zn-binding protein involved in type VI secretion